MAVATLLLRDVGLLQGSAPEAVAALAAQVSLQEFARRQVLYEKGSRGSDLFFVVAGRLQAVDHTVDAREVGLYFVDPGQHFGEMALFGQPQREETMIALGPAKVLRLPGAQARDFCARQPGVAWQLATLMAARLRDAAVQRRLLALPHPAQRVGAQLLELLAPALAAARSPLVIEHMPTHQELAIMINASRETVTRVFQQLQTRAIVQRDGANLRVLDLVALRKMAEGGE